MKALTHSLALFFVVASSSIVSAADKTKKETSVADKVAKATNKLTAKSYDLKYRFKKGEEIRYDVVHLVTMETRIKGITKVAKSRSVSTKLWRISDVDKNGNITFVYFVEKAAMWQSLTGQPEVRYDSEKDKKAPLRYQKTADSIGVPISRVTINNRGKIVKRANLKQVFSSSIGGLTIPLPPKPVKIGASWFDPRTIIVEMPGRGKRKLKAREFYKLQKVENGVATISMKTQVLTPINNPQIQSQLIQMLKEGTIKFDIGQGRVRAIQMDFDDTVLAFAGAESLMKYLARFTERLQTGAKGTRTALRAKSERGGKPKLRRD